MDFFQTISPDERPIFLASLPVKRGDGPSHLEVARNGADVEKFIATYDKENRALYYGVARPKDGATTRNKETVSDTCHYWGDIDFKDHPDVEPYEIRRRLEASPMPPSFLVMSGHGIQPFWALSEPEDVSTPEARQRTEKALRLACAYVGGDPQVAEVARLMRLPGSHNRKFGDEIPVAILPGSGRTYEASDLVEFWSEAQPILSIGEAEEHERRPPVDVAARLSGMRFGGKGDAAVHPTQTRVTASLLCAGIPFEDVVEQVLDATKRYAGADPRCAGWDWTEERGEIEKMSASWVDKNPDLAATLPEKLRARYEEMRAAGLSPRVCYNRDFGVFVRRGVNGTEKGKAEPEDKKEDKKGPRFKLVPFSDMRPGVEPLYLIDELIPVAGIVDVWGKPKCFKSFVVSDMMLHVALGMEYRDRYVRQGPVVYCAFEGAHGYRKRIEAMRRHYKIGADEAVPFYVMPGQANLIAEHRLLISDIASQLGEIVPAVVVLDTLNKSLIGSESKDVDMGAYVRAAEAVRDAFRCVVIIVHHCGLDETRPRGHTSLPGAVDAQLAVVRQNTMVSVTVEMMRDGPEDTVVTSAVEVVEVGQDANGKTLTSLVVVPCDDAPISGGGWPKSLREFQRALGDTLKDHGEVIHELADEHSPRARAADLAKVREEFYRTYPATGETAKQQQDARKHAFNRSMNAANWAGLIRVRVLPDGRQMAWPVQPVGEG